MKRSWCVVLPLLLSVACTKEVGVDDQADVMPPSGGSNPEPGRRQPPLDFGPTVLATTPPPPISGGTLAILRDGARAVAADPDRDRVYIVDLVRRAVAHTVALEPGDEPGRVVEDGRGRVHVSLRRGGAVVSLDPRDGRVLARRPVCAAPRGLAVAEAADLLHVACAGGELVSLPLADGPPVRTLQLPRDLRDVVVQDGRLLVSRFRSAEILVVESEEPRWRTQTLPTLTLSRDFLVRRRGTEPGRLSMSPSVAWRLIPAGSGGALVLHQRGFDGEVPVLEGGYGGSCSVVQSVVTRLSGLGHPGLGAGIAGMGMAVDVAISPDGQRVAVVSPGRPGSPTTQLLVARSTDLLASTGAEDAPCVSVPKDPQTTDPASSSDGGAGVADAGTDDPPEPIEFRQPGGLAIAVAFDPRGDVLVQTREPAALEVVTRRGVRIALSSESRADTGHDIFHQPTGAGLACASCHPEGGEDGRTWIFESLGRRRTQTLQGGLQTTAPFHWDGTLPSLGTLMKEVFVGRMRGPQLSEPETTALGRWMDHIPFPGTASPRDPAAVDRGRAVFQGARAACATCHNGAALTNNQTVDVGTGGRFQVPSLRGLVWRAPFMHDGCAATLADRFTDCGGDARHGAVTKLTAQEQADLIAYLESL